MVQKGYFIPRYHMVWVFQHVHVNSIVCITIPDAALVLVLSHQTTVKFHQYSKITSLAGNFVYNILPPGISWRSTINHIFAQRLASLEYNIHSFLSQLSP